MYKFRERRRFGIFHQIDNLSCVAGGAYLFGRDDGLRVYYYHQGHPSWALIRGWNFFLFSLVHIGHGEAVYPKGWYIVFPKLEIKKISNGFSVQLWKADLRSFNKFL